MRQRQVFSRGPRPIFFQLLLPMGQPVDGQPIDVAMLVIALLAAEWSRIVRRLSAGTPEWDEACRVGLINGCYDGLISPARRPWRE